MVDSDVERDEKEALQAKAWDLWLNCLSVRAVAECIGAGAHAQPLVRGWKKCVSLRDSSSRPAVNTPTRRTRNIGAASSTSTSGSSRTVVMAANFGRMPPQIVENLLWLFTEPSDIVFDPFADSGTTIDAAKAMGRRVWASNINPSTPNFSLR
jgi:hypothetical protein